MTAEPPARTLRGERWFRWRGREVSRLEALTDMVFAFALTLDPITHSGRPLPQLTPAKPRRISWIRLRLAAAT